MSLGTFAPFVVLSLSLAVPDCREAARPTVAGVRRNQVLILYYEHKTPSRRVASKLIFRRSGPGAVWVERLSPPGVRGDCDRLTTELSEPELDSIDLELHLHRSATVDSCRTDTIIELELWEHHELVFRERIYDGGCREAEAFPREPPLLDLSWPVGFEV